MWLVPEIYISCQGTLVEIFSQIFFPLFQPFQKYRSLATKVLIQMATKLKAIPWVVNIPMKHAMIVGFDTYHEKEGDMRGASVGALVNVAI